MNDSVILRKFDTSIDELRFRNSAIEWLEVNLSACKYRKTERLDKSTVGKPKFTSTFSKAVQKFKSDTKSKLGRIYTLSVYEGQDWRLYSVLTYDQLYTVIKRSDARIALQLKLSLY
jgi:hypothetical protein